ncbi:putative cystathionine gamma-synthase protein [Zalerion maritima]|uniref:Cystathionine gamma-synthase protein n=1 Tax=Zalerion maritima TaxID=339359 RepID=A0AAD5RMU1_9PEZI|nr:putative cystathionine gamma-synthase protein [Zalerion maritima]
MPDTKGAHEGPDSLDQAFPGHQLSLSSRAVHADDYMNSSQAVAPPMHVSTTFRYDRDPEKLKQWENIDPTAPYDSHIYSRDSAPNTTRFEALLTSVLGGASLTYTSGLAAFHALLVQLNPKRIAIGPGYHGCHGVVELMKRLTGLEVVDLDQLPGKSPEKLAATGLTKGDLFHVETPINPTGEARDLATFIKIAKTLGCYVSVDATFGPPPLQDPVGMGADVAMHSGTKYLGGHSDMLCGVLTIHPERAKEGWVEKFKKDRLLLGSVMGSLEGWLGVRSMRTLELRVLRQSESATKLVEWLASSLGDKASLVSKFVARVHHASLQTEAKKTWLSQQMPGGFGPVFSIVMEEEKQARYLPSKLSLFHHATSLGGVESLIEWRALTDSTTDKRLLRISIGVEAWEDLKEDLLKGFAALAGEKMELEIRPA